MKANRLGSTLLLLFSLTLLGACGNTGETLDTAVLGKDLGSLISKATEKLGSINDLESAKQVLPDLREVDGELGDVVGKVKALSPEAKTKLVSVAKSAMPALESAVSKVMAMDGLGDTIGPVVKSMMAKLESLS